MGEHNTIVYNKLVRDRIPDIIAQSGKTCTTRVLDAAEYVRMLDAKLDEELREYHQDQRVEELADLKEVIRACALARGCSPEELERIRRRKAMERGAFSERIMLIDVQTE